MKNKIDYIGLYKAFVDLQDQHNALDVLEELSNNIDAIEELAHTTTYEAFMYSVDDTTRVYTSQMIGLAQKLHAVAAPLCDDFLGISTKDAETLQTILAEFLVAYGIILYRVKGYSLLAEQYALTNSIDISQLDLPRELLDELSADSTHVIDVMRTIRVVFDQFGAYFPEYQIADDEVREDVISALEEMDKDAEYLTTLSKEEVRRILSRINN